MHLQIGILSQKNSSKILTQEPFLGREMERLSRSIVKEVISFDSRLFI